MKKLVMLFIVGFLPTMMLLAQTSKGQFILSGGTGLQFTAGNSKYIYDGETRYDYSTSTLSFIPSFGYFAADNLAIGLAGNIALSSEKDEDGDKYTSTSVLLMPTVLYFFPMVGKIRPLVQLGAGFASMVTKDIPKSGNNDKSSGSGFAFNFGGGIAYFVKENVSFNFGLSYTNSTLTDGDDDKMEMKQGNFGGNIGISVFF